jgi:hypothetical protein
MGTCSLQREFGGQCLVSQLDDPASGTLSERASTNIHHQDTLQKGKSTLARMKL